MDSVLKVICLLGLTLMTVYCVSGKMCSYKKAKPMIRYKVVHKPCTKSVQKRCSWYSLSFCTFYESSKCTFESNTTYYTYHTIMDCCTGFIMAPNRSCVDLIKVQNEQWYIDQLNQNTTTEGSVYVDPAVIVTIAMPTETDSPETEITKVTDKDNGLSHGVYAGIACGLLFICVILVLTIIALRKKRRRRTQKENEANDQNTALSVYPEET